MLYHPSRVRDIGIETGWGSIIAGYFGAADISVNDRAFAFRGQGKSKTRSR